MDFIIELVLDLLLEGGMEACKSTWVPKFIRYPLAALILLFFAAVTGLVLYAGAGMVKEGSLGGIFFLALGLLMVVFVCGKVRELYARRKA